MSPEDEQTETIDRALARRCSVGDIPTRSAATFGPRPALVDARGVWTYDELESYSARCANGLLSAGARPGDRIALASTNCREFVAAYLGTAKAGMVSVPLNLLVGPEAIVDCLRRSGADVVFCHADLAPLLGAVVAAVPGIRSVVVLAGDGPAPAIDGVESVAFEDFLAESDADPGIPVADRQVVQCLFSSGTTSSPKGVLTSHLAVTVAALANCTMMGVHWGPEPDATTIVLPLFHTAALNGALLSSLVGGSTVHLLAGFDPEQYARTIAESRSNFLIGMPMMFEAMASVAERDGLDLTSIRRLVYAMAPMPKTLRDRLTALLPDADILLGSGMSECTPCTVLQWPDDPEELRDAWGHPGPATLNLVVDPATGEPAAPGQDGEIAYRGPAVMEGYLDDPEATAAAFAGGHLHSGDVGHLDPERVVFFSDRLKDMVKSGGENVPSLLVERILLDHPHVAEAACIGRPDPRWGERVVAVVVGTPDAPDAQALAESVSDYGREHLASSQRPREVVVVDSLPRTATGKIRKVALRDELPDRSAE